MNFRIAMYITIFLSYINSKFFKDIYRFSTKKKLNHENETLYDERTIDQGVEKLSRIIEDAANIHKQLSDTNLIAYDDIIKNKFLTSTNNLSFLYSRIIELYLEFVEGQPEKETRRLFVIKKIKLFCNDYKLAYKQLLKKSTVLDMENIITNRIDVITMKLKHLKAVLYSLEDLINFNKNAISELESKPLSTQGSYNLASNSLKNDGRVYTSYENETLMAKQELDLLENLLLNIRSFSNFIKIKRYQDICPKNNKKVLGVSVNNFKKLI